LEIGKSVVSAGEVHRKRYQEYKFRFGGNTKNQIVQ